MRFDIHAESDIPGEMPKEPNPALRIMTGQQIMLMNSSKAEYWVEPILTGPGLWLCVGSQKSGKTLLSAQIALSLQAPQALLGWFTIGQPGAVLFVEADDPSGAGALKEILGRTQIPVHSDRFLSVEHANFALDPDFIASLEQEIIGRNLRLIVLDSYTALRASRKSGSDFVKSESHDLQMLDALAKRTNCLIILIHHASKSSAALDWSDQSAGSYAMGAHSEGQIHVSRFRDLASSSPERLVRIRGRHVEGIEFVVRFDAETLGYRFVMEGAASAEFPRLQQVKLAFGDGRFTPKDLTQEIGMARTSAFGFVSKMTAAGAIRKVGHGEYRLEVSL